MSNLLTLSHTYFGWPLERKPDIELVHPRLVSTVVLFSILFRYLLQIPCEELFSMYMKDC